MRKSNYAKPIARQWVSWLSFTHTIERENRCAGWLNKAIANGPRGNKVPTSSGLGLLQLGAIVGKLTNALLQVAEHVVGLRFDCLGKGSVDTVGLGVELSLADLNLFGIHLCYLFFRW
jgi:hypothetical protein